VASLRTIAISLAIALATVLPVDAGAREALTIGITQFRRR